MQQPGLHFLDYFVVLLSIIIFIGVGASFTRRQKTTDKYFAGGRSIPAWAVGMSILATLISSVTFWGLHFSPIQAKDMPLTGSAWFRD